MKIYRCKVCGKLILVLKDSPTTPVCCNQEMELLNPKEEDPSIGEKHVPTVCFKCDCVLVQVGEELHPHEIKHYIEWIILETRSGYQIKYLSPKDEPIVKFKYFKRCPPIAVYAYCNIHGLWKKGIGR